MAWRRQWHSIASLQSSCPENPTDGGAWWAAVHGVAKSRTRPNDFTFTLHFHALQKETATHSSVLAWRIPGTGEPGGLPSVGSHRVGHGWSDLAAAAAKEVAFPYTPPPSHFPHQFSQSFSSFLKDFHHLCNNQQLIQKIWEYYLSTIIFFIFCHVILIFFYIIITAFCPRYWRGSCYALHHNRFINYVTIEAKMQFVPHCSK